MSASRTTRKPPKMRELLQDPIFRKMMTTSITVPKIVGLPFAVYALKTNERWVGKLFENYASAFEMLKTILSPMNRDHYIDASLVCRSGLHEPPVRFNWESLTFSWCGRCRRPTTYKRDQGLHALRSAPILSTDEPYRCYFCGMRKVNQPHYQPIMMTKAEHEALLKLEEGTDYDKPTRRRR